MMNEKELLILIGTAGMGKTTVRKQFNGFVPISSDEVRREIYASLGMFNDRYIEDLEPMAWRIIHERIIATLKNGKSVIMDATNLKDRENYVKIAREHDATLNALFFDINPHTAKRRNRRRPKITRVPENVVNAMITQWKMLKKNGIETILKKEGFHDVGIVKEVN